MVENLNVNFRGIFDDKSKGSKKGGLDSLIDKTIKIQEKKQKTKEWKQREAAKTELINARAAKIKVGADAVKTRLDMATQRHQMWLSEKEKREAMKTRIKEMATGHKMTVNNFKRALEKENIELLDNGDLLDKSTGKIVTQEAATKRLTRANMKFKMELLSVMFFGMAVNRMFSSMIAGSAQASGATEVLGAMTMMIGLPAMMSLTNVLLSLFNVFNNLPEPIKTVISWFMVTVATAASLLASYAALKLGMWGLKMAGIDMNVVFSALNKTMWNSPWFRFAAVLIIIYTLVQGLIMIFENWGKKSSKVVEGVLYTLIAIGGIIAFIAGAPALLVGGIVAAAAGLVWFLAQFKPVQNAFEWIANVAMGLWHGAGSLITGKGWSAGWNKGYAGLPQMASGGIVTRPTLAMIGESGPEAVVPLGSSGFGGTFSPTININNPMLSTRQDIDNLAKKINEILYTELRRLGVR